MSTDSIGTTLDSVVIRLQSMALDDTEPGQMLPSEGDLALRLGVSRLTIREALKVLSGRGLVELSRGRRPVVRDRDSSVLAGYLASALRRDPHGLLELNEIRQSLEALSASSAARNASRAALSAVQAALADMESAAEIVDRGHGAADLERYHSADIAFHEALALASGNRMLAFVLESLSDCLHDSFVASAHGHFARGGTSTDVVRAHRAIMEAVRSGDPVAAASAMKDHLTDAGRDLRAAMPSGPPVRRDERDGARQ